MFGWLKKNVPPTYPQPTQSYLSVPAMTYMQRKVAAECFAWAGVYLKSPEDTLKKLLASAPPARKGRLQYILQGIQGIQKALEQQWKAWSTSNAWQGKAGVQQKILRWPVRNVLNVWKLRPEPADVFDPSVITFLKDMERYTAADMRKLAKQNSFARKVYERRLEIPQMRYTYTEKRKTNFKNVKNIVKKNNTQWSQADLDAIANYAFAAPITPAPPKRKLVKTPPRALGNTSNQMLNLAFFNENLAAYLRAQKTPKRKATMRPSSVRTKRRRVMQ